MLEDEKTVTSTGPIFDDRQRVTNRDGYNGEIIVDNKRLIVEHGMVVEIIPLTP